MLYCFAATRSSRYLAFCTWQIIFTHSQLDLIPSGNSTPSVGSALQPGHDRCELHSVLEFHSFQQSDGERATIDVAGAGGINNVFTVCNHMVDAGAIAPHCTAVPESYDRSPGPFADKCVDRLYGSM